MPGTGVGLKDIEEHSFHTAEAGGMSRIIEQGVFGTNACYRGNPAVHCEGEEPSDLGTCPGDICTKTQGALDTDEEGKVKTMAPKMAS